jgi:L-cysteine:1D-myo-inositol 2-amino-2-deoxy-alpha-D-glucopyranoside ligase
MKFYDTAKNGLVDFAPKQKTVRMYVCGITPYDSAHLGHIFTFLTYDLLQRRLEDLGYEVKMVRNVTDVDEPIFVRAHETGEKYTDLAARETADFQKIMKQMNFLEPFGEPKASEYIQEMAQAVKKLLEKDFAYRLENDIYFDVSKRKNFGEFSEFSTKLQLNFMQERGGDPERPGKRHKLDFLLWRGIADPKDSAAWDSPVGRGRPGWHIECSVMSSKLLGMPIDIHGGGMDLIFPHHECEIAQSESLGVSPFAKHWLHAAPMLLYGEKMSKSLGNLIFAKDLLKTGYGSPAALRLALFNYHYATGGEWRWELWHAAKQFEKDIQIALTKPTGPNPEEMLHDIKTQLDNNLNTPEILRILRTFVTSMQENRGTHKHAATGLRNALALLGVTI